MQQYYIQDNRPASNSAKDLFAYCVEKVKENHLFSHAYMHNQWANMLFGYEKRSDLRIDMMSIVKREYSIYFTNNLRYSFNKNKIRRDSRYFWQKDEKEAFTSDDIKSENKSRYNRK